MKTLRSYVCGRWYEAKSGFVPLHDPATEEEVGRAGSAGIDFAAVLAHAAEKGGPALRALTVPQRGDLLRAMSKALREKRDELLELSRLNTGTTRADGAFDVDGASGTLAYYAGLARSLGERTFLTEGDGVMLARSEGFWGQHLLVPRRGVAVHVNAFNFPAWGFAEKAACALAAGMPVVTKPATATAMVAERCVEIVVEAGILPEGALQLVVGGTGDLLDRLGSQDVLAFTGSLETALTLRGRPRLHAVSTRFNVEADSLNAAVLGPDVAAEGPTCELFLRDVVREMTQKSGQKCTAVRRILVPRERLRAIEEALAERLRQVVTGNPADPAVTMGPLATAGQLAVALEGLAELRQAARLVHGSGARADGAGSPPGKGHYLGPTLLLAGDGAGAGPIHSREVFAPVATLLPYSGAAGEAGALVALGGGTLVTSVYGDDADWLAAFSGAVAPTTGRLYVGTEGSAADAPGSGIVLPQVLHGGPGRAGGGEELGGLTGIKLYMHRAAIQGHRATVERLAGLAP
jgi:oxepin-CoA hydrolase/3-oxo-5,6-dehydrosuberyl-CoA semialdehyde dehydrogenase